METMQLKMSSARVIKEHESADSDSDGGRPKINLFAQLASKKQSTHELESPTKFGRDRERDQNQVSFEDMINNGVEMTRTISVTG